MVCVHSLPPHQGARRSLNCDSYPGHGSQARTFMRVRPPGGGGGPPAETLLLPRNRRPPRRRSCRPVLSSGLILPILRACARTGVKIRDPRRHIGQWWNVLHWNTLHRFPHMHACGTNQEIRRLTRITPHLTRAIQPRNLRQRRTAPNTPPRANTVHLSRVRAERANNSHIHTRDAPTRTARRRPFAGALSSISQQGPLHLIPSIFRTCARRTHARRTGIFSMLLCGFSIFFGSRKSAQFILSQGNKVSNLSFSPPQCSQNFPHVHVQKKRWDPRS